MSLRDKLGLTDDNLTQTQTQALYGGRVYILAEQAGWDEVAVPGQPTPKNPLGNPGWVPSVQLTAGHGFAALPNRQPFALVKAPTAWLYDNSALTRENMQISANTRLLMYIGHQQMIEAYDATTVRITAVCFGPDYRGAERFLRPGAAR